MHEDKRRWLRKKDSRIGPDRFCRVFADSFGYIRSDRILFCPKQSNSLIFNSIRSNLIFFRFYLVLFDFTQSNSVLLDLLLHTRALCKRTSCLNFLSAKMHFCWDKYFNVSILYAYISIYSFFSFLFNPQNYARLFHAILSKG